MALIADADVAIIRSPVCLDRRTLAAAGRLRLILRAGMGVESIDMDFARRRGIGVALVPLSADSVAEHTFGLLLSLYRRIPWFCQTVREGRWEKHSGLGSELSGKTLGLVGFGRVGIRTAEIARAFGMGLLACDRSPHKPHKQEAAARLGVRFAPLDELFSAADAVAIQTPLNEQTRGLIGARLIGRMPPHAVIVNVGRGKVVDEQALYEALQQGRLGGAALDVFAAEPPGESPLLGLDNFIATPHVGAQTVEAQRKIGADVVRIVDAMAGGEDLASHGAVVVCPPRAAAMASEGART
ncbi:hydroxyacid dehydrogenase [bacterium]|nr:hydroxyacid dehydrogenase [bacterium]